ncbi:ribonuclease D [Thiosulfativibrio zosterae]|uniref:Ribonuclease D n=1 Tax=Thiosulfativibrio zosterae TaxID=2675053 RepID=A0A6F8PMC2_9GAMM|nr:ribonuclease D [Thiosulfativibrio zosterae]BBP43194.1 ribonuclease D [Thiosulfativibrio zosterae]
MTNIITNTDALAPFCAHLQTCKWMAIDTEFMRVDTYYPELCLIQVQSSAGQLALIDPLAFNQMQDLKVFWDCLSNPNLIKVFHSARQDIEVLYQVSQQMPVAIFDTQIAGVFLNYGNLAGLAKMVEAELGILLEKDQTRTHWERRPLSDKQIAYAADDVKYLAPLYEKIVQQLSQEQLAVLQADFQDLLNPIHYDNPPVEAGHKLKGTKGLNAKQLAICFRLAEWREHFAITRNKPKRWVLSDECIVDIAKRPPITVEALYKVPNIKSSSIKSYGAEWIAIIDDVFQHPETWPAKVSHPAPPSSEEAKLIDLAQALLTQIAHDINCPPNNLANKADLLAMVRSSSAVLKGWRHFVFEQPFKKLLLGEVSLKIQNQQLTLE